MKKVSALLVLISGTWLLFSAPSCQSEAKAADTISVLDTPVVDTVIKVHLSFVGDLMCHSTQYEFAQVGPDSFDFYPCFTEVKPFLSKADFALGNLETTLSGKKPWTGYPQFNSPDAYLDAVVDAGFDFLVTSNNHSLDTKEDGLLRTIEQVRARGVGSTGTYNSQQDRDSIRVVDVKGIQFAILDYTYGTNGLPIPEGKPWTVNLIDTALIRQDIAAARKTTADLVVVCLHYGAEYKREPDAYQRMVVKHVQACGADLIIGGHPHVVQPMEYFKTAPGAKLDSGFVAWSLGNFISNQYNRYTDSGVILNLEISKDPKNDSIYISEASYLPTWVWRGRGSKKIHVVLPSERHQPDSLYSYIDVGTRPRMKNGYDDVQEIVNKYGAGLTKVSAKP